MNIRGLIFSIILSAILLGCMGFAVPADLAGNLLIGWAFFLARARAVHLNGDGILTAMVCLVLLSVGLDRFLGWLFEQMQTPRDSGPAARWKHSWTAALIVSILLMFISGLASAGIAHQAGWLLSSGQPWTTGGTSIAAERSQSVNNLKQAGFALHNYHEATGSLPPGGAFDQAGRAYHSWQALILSMTEEKALYNQINFDVPWNDGRNRTAIRTQVNMYLNPGQHSGRADGAQPALSHYAGNALVLGGNLPRTFREVSDGQEQTIMAGEVAAGFKPWGNPVNWRDPSQGINRVPEGFGSPFRYGVNFLFVDGSVRFLKNSVSPPTMKALATPNGGETVSRDAY